MSGFIDTPETERPNPYVFLQWKGTDACFDFYCKCGAHCHFDGDFAYVVECPHCLTKWEMPCMLYPREVGDKTYGGHTENAKTMDPDEDHSDEVTGPDGITRHAPRRLP